MQRRSRSTESSYRCFIHATGLGGPMTHSNAPDIILLEGIEVPAALGVTEAERQMRRPVRLDLELGLDLRPSGQTDDLSQTVDYGEIYEVVEKVAGGREHKLVEALGERIADALFESFPVESVQLTVRKSKPIAGVLDWVGVRITRTR